jgi:hypothetical protein
MGLGADIARDVTKGVVLAATIGALTLVWQYYFGSTAESAVQKAHTPIVLLQWQVWLWAAVTVFLLGFGIFASLRKRSSDSDAVNTKQSTLDPKIEIVTGEAAPYHVTGVQGGRALNTVRVGIRNAGGKTLSNCKVYVEKLSPPANLPGGDTQLLDMSPFQLRHDDPEKLMDIAAHWDHVSQFRFSTPMSGGFFDTGNYMEDGVKRTFAVRVSATECERSALFEIWTDESRRLNLKFLNYIN